MVVSAQTDRRFFVAEQRQAVADTAGCCELLAHEAVGVLADIERMSGVDVKTIDLPAEIQGRSQGRVSAELGQPRSPSSGARQTGPGGFWRRWTS